MGERRFGRWSVLLGSGVLTLAACDGGITVGNGQPRVTWVAVEPLEPDRAALTIWLEDAEGDAVDVAISWAGGGKSGSLSLAPGSAPLLGLPTELGLGSDEGQPHRVLWDLTGVPDGAVELTLQVDDRPHKGSAGDIYRVQGLDPRVGGGPITATP